jgi:processive 1,2-diacylglycerol beta-glucosyltransferase
MDASDIVITKPGGVTTAECLIKGLPMVVFEPIPGQETRNARYLMRHDAALIADDIDELCNVVQRLVEHPGKREEMSKRALAIARPDASEDIARLIMEKIKV